MKWLKKCNMNRVRSPFATLASIQYKPSVCCFILGHFLSAKFPHLLVKVLPVVLRHQSEEREEGPTKGVETGVAIVGVRSHSLANVPLWAPPAANTASVRFANRGWIQSHGERCLPSVAAISTEQRIFFAGKVVMIFWLQKKNVSLAAVAAEAQLKALEYACA